MVGLRSVRNARATCLGRSPSAGVLMARMDRLILQPRRRQARRRAGWDPDSVLREGTASTGDSCGARGARRRPRRRRGRIAALVLAVLLGALALILAGYLVTPGTRDAESRVEAIAAAHGGVDAAGVSHTRLARAVVAVEDRRFYDHGALDLLALARSTWARLSGSNVDPGGSTISQQLAKVLYGQRAGVLGPVQDVFAAFKLESLYSKSKILEMYLNSVYFGDGAYGPEQASERYFHKPVTRLDWAEATMLAGLPQAPSAYDPLAHFNRARARQHAVLQAAVRAGLLTAAQAARAFRELRTLAG